MFDPRLEHGIMSTYDEAIFLRQVPRSSWPTRLGRCHNVARVKPPAAITDCPRAGESATPAGAWRLKHRPIISDNQAIAPGVMSVRQAIWHIGHEVQIGYVANNNMPKDNWIRGFVSNEELDESRSRQ